MKKIYILLLLLILPRFTYSQNPCPGVPTIDYAGRTYHSVMIGAQCWLKENLSVGNKINGIQEQTNNSIIEKYCYGDDTANCTTFGGLYEWAEAVQYQNGATNSSSLTTVFSSNVQGICPSAWHLPTNAELTTLSTSVTNHSDALLAVGQNSGTNTSGFSAVLGGQRDAAGTFSAFGSHASFLTITEVNSNSAYNLYLTSGSNGQFAWRDSKPMGLSARCLIDTLPKLTLNYPSNNDQDVPMQPTLSWNDFPGTTAYTLEVQGDNNLVVSDSTITTNSYKLPKLPQSTLYHWRVKAKNSYGSTAWTESRNFMTMPQYCPGLPTITYSGHTYKTVLLGKQCWLRENLNVGTLIQTQYGQSDNGIIEKYCFANDSIGCDRFGGLFQWAEAVQYKNGANNYSPANFYLTGNVQGICPVGWHIPSDADFYLVVNNYSSPSLMALGSGYYGEGTNTTGFSMIDAPFFNGTFSTGIDNWGFWTSGDHPDPVNGKLGIIANLLYNFTSEEWVDKTDSYSVRCLMDNTPFPILLSPVNGSTDVTLNPILSWSNFAGIKNYTLLIAKDSLFTNIVLEDKSLTLATKQLSGLAQSTQYYWKVNIVDDFGPSYFSNTWKFTTAATSCKDFATVAYAGKTYHTLQVGSQCWLKENLDVGTRVNGSVTQANNSILEKYCYNDDSLNCKTYGGLYQWREAMQYASAPGAQGICPAGWHIPSKEDYDTLTTTVKGNANVLLAIGQAKGNNTTGFSALFAGKRNDLGVFADLGKNSTFWTSTPYFYYMDLNYIDSTMYSNTYVKEYGLSVRCIYGDVLTDNKDKATIPNEYDLKQNYPNPFNPSTKIEYALPSSGQVKLQVFTVEGELVKTLVSEHQEAGNYSVDFSGKNLSSGMYIYKLSLNDRNIFKKMLFLK